MKQAPIDERLASEIEPILEKMGIELVDLEFKRDQVGRVLRIFIDKPDGIDLDTCSRASEVISNRLDEIDIIETTYNLEVSSPGVERPLVKPKDFQRFIGRKVAVKTAEPIDGRRKFKGVLTEASVEGFKIESNGQTLDFKYDNLKKANLVFEF